MILFDPDLAIITFLLLVTLFFMLFINIGSQLGNIGILLIIAGLLFGWPLAIIGLIALIIHARNKRKKV